MTTNEIRTAAFSTVRKTLQELTTRELRAICKSYELTGASKLTKKALVQLIVRAEGERRKAEAPAKPKAEPAKAKPAKAKAAKAKAAKAKAAKAKAEPQAELPTARRIMNAVGKLGTEERTAMAEALEVETKDGKRSRFTKDICRDIAKAIVAAGALPEGLTVGRGSRPKVERPRDPRLPKAGTKLTREYKGATLTTTVRERDFLYEGETYTSLSTVAKVATGGGIWNGFLFWGLIKRTAKAKEEAAA